MLKQGELLLERLFIDIMIHQLCVKCSQSQVFVFFSAYFILYIFRCSSILLYARNECI